MSTRIAHAPLLPNKSAARRHGVVASHGALVFAAAIFSGFNVVLSHCLDGGVSPLTFAAVRETVALVLLYAWAATAEGPLRWPARRHRGEFLVLGVLLGGFQILFACGVSLTDADTAALFQCIEPTTAAALGALLQQERFTATKALSALFAGGGVLLIQLAALEARHAPASNRSDDGMAPQRGSAQLLGCALLFGQVSLIVTYDD